MSTQYDPIRIVQLSPMRKSSGIDPIIIQNHQRSEAHTIGQKIFHNVEATSPLSIGRKHGEPIQPNLNTVSRVRLESFSNWIMGEITSPNQQVLP